MSETNLTEPSFQIQRIYLKDLSLEQPNTPAILLVQAEPQMQVEVDIGIARLSDGLFEVMLSGTITARVEGKTLFLIEAKQAGIFEFKNIPAEQIEPMLAIACPTLLYPYLRSNIADMVSRAGFQPIHLAEINFHAMYEQRLAQAAETAKGADEGNTDEEKSKIILPN